MGDQKSQVERLLDAAVYAPLGFLLTRDQVVADLAVAGRKQIAFSRSLGRAALKGLAKGTGSATKPTNAAPDAKSERVAPVSTEVRGYGDMTAKEVIAYLGGCNAAEASWIRAQETAGKKRVTVLRALDARG